MGFLTRRFKKKQTVKVPLEEYALLLSENKKHTEEGDSCLEKYQSLIGYYRTALAAPFLETENRLSEVYLDSLWGNQLKELGFVSLTTVNLIIQHLHKGFKDYGSFSEEPCDFVPKSLVRDTNMWLIFQLTEPIQKLPTYLKSEDFSKVIESLNALHKVLTGIIECQTHLVDMSTRYRQILIYVLTLRNSLTGEVN